MDYPVWSDGKESQTILGDDDQSAGPQTRQLCLDPNTAKLVDRYGRGRVAA
jgi:hypothetical protein